MVTKPDYGRLRCVLENLCRHPDILQPEAVWWAYKDGVVLHRVRGTVAIMEMWAVWVRSEDGRSLRKVPFRSLLRVQSEIDGEREWARSANSPKAMKSRRRLRLLKVSAGDLGVYEGYTRRAVVNDLMYVLLPRESVQQIVDALNSRSSQVDGGHAAWYNPTRDEFVFEDPRRREDRLERAPGCNVDVGDGLTMHLYAVGRSDWRVFGSEKRGGMSDAS